MYSASVLFRYVFQPICRQKYKSLTKVSLVNMSDLIAEVEVSAEDTECKAEDAESKEKKSRSARAAPKCKACGQLVK